MGEVYRAHDRRLKRDVAIKILRPSLALADEHVHRIIKEARTAGTLSHPNIMAVYDVGRQDGTAYVVCELLKGETLRAKLDRGPVPFKKALEYAIQIAEALGAAHEKGIWHCDVKPANVFVTTDGRVKLLDFGLAKLQMPPPAGPDDSTASKSRPGGVRGTAGYISPEQVMGEPLDARADLFALGAVLYELLTGARAFQRSSGPEAMIATLRDDPADPLEVRPDLSPAAAAVLRRCLEKNREERFQSARDLAFHLQQLQYASASVQGAGHSGPRVVAVLGLVAAAATLTAVFLAARSFRPQAAPAFEQLTFRRARVGSARFASESRSVVYSEARDGNTLQVWRLDLAARPHSSSLAPYGGADVLASRGGELALAVRRHFAGGKRFVGTLAIAPADGSAPREKASDVEDADWDPAGTEMAVVRSAGLGSESRLEYPLGHTLYKSDGAIRFPRVSRDGRRIAFLDDRAGHGIRGRVAVVDLQGQFTALTADFPSARGLAWSADGEEVWFTAADGRNNRALRAVDLEGKARLVLQAPTSLTLWDIAPDGRLLLTHDEERNALACGRAAGGLERDWSWYDASGLANISADGRQLLFGDRFGIYVRRTDEAAPPTQLGLPEGYADDLSPDGRWVLATTPPTTEIVLLPTGPGDSRSVAPHGITGYKGALWLDDHRIVFNATEPGHAVRSYVQDVSPYVQEVSSREAAAESPPPTAFTPHHTGTMAVAPGGALVATIEADQRVAVRTPVPGSEPRYVQGGQVGDRPASFSADGRWLWVFRRGQVPAEVFRLSVTTSERQSWKKLMPPDPAGVYSVITVRVTPDGDTYCYSYARAISQLYIARDLK